MASSPEDTTLNAYIKAQINFLHKRTDLTLSENSVKDNLGYNKLNLNFTNGSGKNKVNLLHHSTRRLINTTESLDLDGVLRNVWEQPLNFDAVNIMVIRNNETAINRFLEVNFKNERYYIGPGGSRLILEPEGHGIEALVSSTSAEEGQLIISSNADITYDLILAGSHAESSSTGL